MYSWLAVFLVVAIFALVACAGSPRDPSLTPAPSIGSGGPAVPATPSPSEPDPAVATASLIPTGPTPRPAPRLAIGVASAGPGERITVSGWAPIVDEGVEGAPRRGYRLVLRNVNGQTVPLASESLKATDRGSFSQSASGDISGTIVVPATSDVPPGDYTVELVTSGLPALAKAPLKVSEASAWSSLGVVRPTLIQTSGFRTQTILTSIGESDLAYCSAGSIVVTRDAGETWSRIPLTAIASDLTATSTPADLTASGKITCTAVALDPAHPDSYFASAQVSSGSPGGDYQVAFGTADAGQSWQQVPLPVATARFAGFEQGNGATYAAYLDSRPSTTPGSVYVEETKDGGRTWTSGRQACPSVGPCVRWTPHVVSWSEQSDLSSLEQVQLSSDRGVTWTTIASPRFRPSELVTIGPQQMVILTTDNLLPVRLSNNGGQNWQAISLPPAESFGSLRALHLLANGALLGQGITTTSWKLLPPGATSWCDVANGVVPSQLLEAAVVGDQVWWLTAMNLADPATPPTHTAISNVRCGS